MRMKNTRQTTKAFRYIKDNTIYLPVPLNNYNITVNKEKPSIQILQFSVTTLAGSTRDHVQNSLTCPNTLGCYTLYRGFDKTYFPILCGEEKIN